MSIPTATARAAAADTAAATPPVQARTGNEPPSSFTSATEKIATDNAAAQAAAAATAQASKFASEGEFHVLDLLRHFNAIATPAERNKTLTPLIRLLSEAVAREGIYTDKKVFEFITNFVQTKPGSPQATSTRPESSAKGTATAAAPNSQASAGGSPPASTSASSTPNSSNTGTAPTGDSSSASPVDPDEALRRAVNVAGTTDPILKEAFKNIDEKLKADKARKEQEEAVKAARQQKKTEAAARATAIEHEGATKVGGINACATYEALREKLDQANFKTPFEEFTEQTRKYKKDVFLEIQTADRANRLALRRLKQQQNSNKVEECTAKFQGKPPNLAKIFVKTLAAETVKTRVDKEATKSFEQIQNKLTDWVAAEKPEKLANYESLNSQLTAFKSKLEGFLKAETAKETELKTNLENARKNDAGSVASQNHHANLTKCAEQVKQITARLKTVEKLIADNATAHMDIAVITDLHSEFTQTERDVHNLPFSLPFMSIGEDYELAKEWCGLIHGSEKDSKDDSNNGLTSIDVNKKNHACSRASSLRQTLSAFTSQLKKFDELKSEDQQCLSSLTGGSRSDVGILGEKLKNPDSDAAHRMVEFLTRIISPENKTGNEKESGHLHLHKLAAGNLVAAGFNTETLELDAPSLRYKIDGGFSILKRAFRPGPDGIAARKPAEHIGRRLDALAKISEVFQEEAFRGGKAASMQHAIQTPEQASEACSILLLALPNDLLVNNADEVSQFLKKVQEFEGLVKNKSVKVDNLNEFKLTIKNFHEQAATWLSARNESSKTINESIALSKETGKGLVEGLRKGSFRKVASTTGHVLNLCGGRHISEGAVSVAKSVANAAGKVAHRAIEISKEETMKWLIKNSPAFVRKRGEAIRDLKTAESEIIQKNKQKDFPNFRKNADAINKFWAGDKIELELVGPLPEQMVNVLIRLGDLMEYVWDQKHKGKAPPHSIKLEAAHLAQIETVRPNAAILRFVKPIVINAAQVETKRTDPRAKVEGDAKGNIHPLTINTEWVEGSINWDDSSSPINTPANSTEFKSDANSTSSTSSTRSTSSQRGFSSPADAAAQAALDRKEVEDSIKHIRDQTVGEWVKEIWQKFCAASDNADENSTTRVQAFTDRIKEIISLRESDESKWSDEDKAKSAEAKVACERIQAAYAADSTHLPDNVLRDMNKYAPILVQAYRGSVMLPAPVYVYEKPLQDVSGENLQCWMRAGWGAAVHALGKQDFADRTLKAIKDLNDKGVIVPKPFTEAELLALHENITANPGQESANEIHRDKKRALILALAEKSEFELDALGKETLKALKKPDNNNVMAEGEFPAALLNALGLPVLINRDELSHRPDVYLPSSFDVNQVGHPTDWPALHHSDNHWRFYKPRETATTTS